MAIKDDKRWIENRRGIGDYFKKKFLELYKSDYQHIPDEVEGVGIKCISDKENKEIIRIPSVEEIKECMEKLYPFKSQGPGWLSRLFLPHLLEHS